MGLGNPGPQYERTRHNIGHRVLHTYARRQGVSFQKFKSHGVLASISHTSGVTLRLGLLSRFMNLSGAPVQAMLAFHKIPPAQLIVVHDDLDLPHGVVRLKSGGGDAGHNGLRDIARALGSADFYRVRMGIGRPGDARPMADYVLQPFLTEQEATLDEFLQTGVDAVETLILEGLSAAQQKFHPATQ